MGRVGAHIAAHISLDRTTSGLNYARFHFAHIYFIFLFFEGPKGRYGPREAWAHMGWVGPPAH